MTDSLTMHVSPLFSSGGLLIIRVPAFIVDMCHLFHLFIYMINLYTTVIIHLCFKVEDMRSRMVIEIK